jgi:chaperonin GroES
MSNPDKAYLLDEWDYEKNKELGLDPKTVTSGTHKKAHWVCKKCGYKFVGRVTFKKYFDKVVVKRVEAQETTKAGILLPGSAQEKPQMSEVVAVGPGGMVDGKEIVMTLSVGDRVIVGKYSGTEVKLDGVEYMVVSQSDILAVIED